MIESEPPAYDAGDEPTPAPHSEPIARRNDRISPIVPLVFIVFWLLQNGSNWFHFPHRHATVVTKSESSASSDDRTPSDVSTGIIVIDQEAKHSYLSLPLAHSPQFDAKFAAKLGDSKVDALKSANDLLVKYADPSLARRVILLRAESNDANPLAAERLAGKKGGIVDPLSAYAPHPGDPASYSALLQHETTTWQELFAVNPSTSDRQLQKVRSDLQSLTGLRWWLKIALHQLYLRKGDKADAARELVAASTEATRSVLVSLLADGCIGIAVIAGLVALLMLGLRRIDGERNPNSLFSETPPLISDNDRRLGAGDLANLFCFYLLMMGIVPEGLSALLKLAYGKALSRMPLAQHETISIIAELAYQVIAGLLTVGALFLLARHRKADLAREIGLNRGGRSIGRVLLFGLMGWAISLPILLVVAFISNLIFHNAPAPANPAIPMLMSAPAGLASILLFTMVSIFAPFFEETVFRGLFYNAARLRLGVPGGILATGLVFGLIHPVGIAEQLPLACLGCVLAWIAQTRKSLLPGMVAHCLQNTTVFVTLLSALMTLIARH